STPRACSLHVRRAECWSLPPLFPPPALRERRHRGLARHLVAVHRLTIFVGQDGPQPWRSNRGRCCFHDAADDGTISEHVELVVVLLPGWAARRSAFED